MKKYITNKDPIAIKNKFIESPNNNGHEEKISTPEFAYNIPNTRS